MRPRQVTPLALRFAFTLRAGESKVIRFVDAGGETRRDAERSFGCDRCFSVDRLDAHGAHMDKPTIFDQAPDKPRHVRFGHPFSEFGIKRGKIGSLRFDGCARFCMGDSGGC